jgi:membrane-anchored glycerophosphoryl diester phosphodiesterase (GDPDase)
MQETLQHGQVENNFDTIMSMLGTLTFFGVATLVLMLGMMFAEIAISIVVSEELNLRSITFKDAIDETFRGKWLYGIGQALLKIIIFVGGVIIVGIVVAILGVISKALMGLILVLLFIVLIPIVIYVVFKWYFSLTAIAVDDLTVMESLRESWHLVTGYWWRTVGILILFSLITQFVIMIVSLPITFGSMWDVYKEYFTMLGKTGGKIDPATLKNFESSFGPGVSISTGISSLLTLLISPVYTVVMYFDLRARNNVMTQSSPAPILQDTSSETPMDFNQM